MNNLFEEVAKESQIELVEDITVPVSCPRPIIKRSSSKPSRKFNQEITIEEARKNAAARTQATQEDLSK